MSESKTPRTDKWAHAAHEYHPDTLVVPNHKAQELEQESNMLLDALKRCTNILSTMDMGRPPSDLHNTVKAAIALAEKARES